MLTNLESQLKQQGAENRLDEVLEEIPEVRKDLGYIPLVTPTSQIVGTQAVLNVLTGERYKSVTRETEALLKGEYGAAPALFNKELQARVLNGADPIICRPADNLKNELDDLTTELKKIASEKNIQLAKDEIDDVLIYSLFPQVGLKFLENRGNPDAFEPPPGEEADVEQGEGVYTVTVNGKSFVAQVSEGGDISGIVQLGSDTSSEPSLSPPPPVASPVPTEPLIAPLAGTILKINIKPGQAVQEESVVIVMEAMKMETEICAHSAGTVKSIFIKEGDTVAVGDALVEFV
jgi:oxaloacetate decarboxylase alpha subunit